MAVFRLYRTEFSSTVLIINIDYLKFFILFSTDSASYVETGGLFTATLELNLELSRDDLARDIECRVESAALPNKLINKFRVDLQGNQTEKNLSAALPFKIVSYKY